MLRTIVSEWAAIQKLVAQMNPTLLIAGNRLGRRSWIVISCGRRHSYGQVIISMRTRGRNQPL